MIFVVLTLDSLDTKKIKYKTTNGLTKLNEAVENNRYRNNIYKDYDVFIINLTETKEGRRRKEIILKMKQNLYKNATFFKGIHGKSYNYTKELEKNVIKEYWDFGKWKKMEKSKIIEMDKGEIGVSLSHYYLWENIVRNGRNTIILEDDAIHINDKFDKYLDFLMSKIPQDWDIFLLGFYLHQGDDGLKVNDFIVKVKNFVLMHATIVSPKGAHKLLNLTPIDKPLDTWLSVHSDKINIYRHNLMNYNKQSTLIQQKRLEKQIKNTNNW